MKVRKSVWIAFSVVSGMSICVFQVGKQQLQAQEMGISSDGLPTAGPQMSPELANQAMARAEWAKGVYEEARANDFKARQNNGSKRGGVALDAIPENLRAQANEMADEYRKSIYPALKAHLAKEGRLPTKPETADLEQFRPFLIAAERKNSAQPMLGHNAWSIGEQWRPDGTIATRDVYSKAADDMPHDVWAQNSRFMKGDILDASGDAGRILVTGWDDGEVTFDRYDEAFQGKHTGPLGESKFLAVSGQAGIPAGTVRAKASVDKIREEIKPAAK